MTPTLPSHHEAAARHTAARAVALQGIWETQPVAGKTAGVPCNVHVQKLLSATANTVLSHQLLPIVDRLVTDDCRGLKHRDHTSCSNEGFECRTMVPE